MTAEQDVSRRAFIGAAAGAGAMSAALAVLGLEGIARAEGDGSTADVDGDAFSSLALPPLAAPGVRIGVLNFTDAVAVDSNSDSATLHFANSGVFNPSGWLDFPLDLPVGARLVRVDVFSRTMASLAVGAALNVTVVGSGNSLIAPLPIAASMGFGQATYAPATPRTVAFGERLYVEVTCESASKVFLGVVYQYYDANPQLNLLPTPTRVYDSRAGAPPTTVVKGALANNNTRVIDCTVGGAVPAGASAAMITLTTVGTSRAGFMALWRNGLADPGTSSINWDHVGTNVAVTTVVAVDETAKLLAKAGPGASTDFIIDVIGFYA